jgi:hypothetical protein
MHSQARLQSALVWAVPLCCVMPQIVQSWVWDAWNDEAAALIIIIVMLREIMNMPAARQCGPAAVWMKDRVSDWVRC